MNQVVESYARWLADFSLLSTILLAASLLGIAIQKQPARRLAVAKSTLVSLILLAVLCAIPGWSVVHLLTEERPQPVAEFHNEVSPKPLIVAEWARPTAPEASPIVHEEAAVPATPDVQSELSFNVNLPWPALLAMAHLAGAICIVLWLGLGWIASAQLRRTAQPAPTDLVAILDRVFGQTPANTQPPQLLIHEQIDVAVALGAWRPMILLPGRWIREESPDRLRTVLAHESTHIINYDLRWVALTRTLFIALWANPLFWITRRWLRRDQEALADAAAAELTSRQQYAEQLVAWARGAHSRPALHLSSAVGLWEGPSQLRQRIALLIDEHFILRRECPRGWRLASYVFCATAALALSLVTIAAVPLDAARPDLPQTSIFQHGIERLGILPHEILKNRPEVQWKVSPVKPESSPDVPSVGDLAVADGVVYGSDGVGRLFAMDAGSGQELWAWQTTDGSAVQAPLIHDQAIYYSCGKGIVALNRQAGTLLWGFEIAGGAAECSPIVVDGKLFITGYDGVMRAIDAQSGEQVWECELLSDAPDESRGEKGKEARIGDTKARPRVPASDGRTIYQPIFDQMRLVAVDVATGKVRWSFKANDWIFCNPVVHDGRVYIGSQDRHIYCLDADTGKEIWRFKTISRVEAGAALCDGKLYFGCCAGVVYCADARSGKELWRFSLDQQNGQSAIYCAPLVTRDGALYIAGMEGQVYCLDAANGKLRWKVRPSDKSEIDSNLATDGERLFIGTRPPINKNAGESAIIALGAAAAPGDANKTGAATANTPKNKPTDSAVSTRTGALTMRFEYDGTPPEPKQLKEWGWRNKQDNSIMRRLDIEKEVGAKVLDESLVVGKDRGIANVFVWVRSRDIPVPPAAELPRPSVSFSKGRFEPHAQAFRAPRHVILRNDDAMLTTNFNYSAFNLEIQPLTQKEVEVEPSQQSIPMRLTSNVYPWANAWVLAIAHPFVAVSDAEGKIRISELPLGKWEFQVWHERPGYLKTHGWQRGRFTLEIKPGENDLGTIKVAPNVFRWSAGLPEIQDWARSADNAVTVPSSANDRANSKTESTRVVGTLYGKSITAADIGLTEPIDTTVQFNSTDKPRYQLMTRIATAFGKQIIDRFVAEQELNPTQEEIQKCKEGMREARKVTVKNDEAGLAQIKNKLASKDLTADQRSKLGKDQQTIERGLVRDRKAVVDDAPIPDELARHFVLAWKIERELHRKFGGRVIFQQFGLEALDARRKLYEEAEKNGDLVFNDPGVRHLFYYYSTQTHHTVIDEKALEHPWFFGGQDLKVNEKPSPELTATTTTAGDEIDPKKSPDSRNGLVRPTSRPKPNTITGRVTDEQGQPIAGAEATLFRINRIDGSRKVQAKTVTDADGKYRFDKVIDIAKEFPGGKLSPINPLEEEFVQVYVRSPKRVAGMGMELRQQIARAGDVFDMLLKPAQSLTGRVTGPDGKPIAGAVVSVGGGGYASWNEVAAARTKPDGTYVIDDAAPYSMEEYRKLRAEQKANMAAALQHDKDVYSIFVTPPILSVAHPDFASKRAMYDKIPGNQDVQLDPASQIAGQVVFADSSKPAAGAIVHLSTSRPTAAAPTQDEYLSMQNADTRTDADGYYAFPNLPAGNYDLSAEMPGWVNAGFDSFTAIIGKKSTPPSLTLTKGGTVAIRLIDDATGKPVEVVPEMRADISAHKYPFPRGLSRPSWIPNATANSAGRFELHVSPGKRAVLVGGVHVGEELKWITKQSRELNPTIVNVVEGKTTDIDVPVTKMPENPRAAINGSVFRTQPALKEEPAKDDQGAVKQNGSQGRGETRSQPDDARAARNAVKPAREKIETYTAPISISGRTLGKDGEPIAGATVCLASQRPGYKRVAETKSDREGKYAFTNVELPIQRSEGRHGDIGEFEVFGTADGYALSWRELKGYHPKVAHYDNEHYEGFAEHKGDWPKGYGADDPIELDLQFGPAVKFRGQVVNDRGKPIANTLLDIRYTDSDWNTDRYNIFSYNGALSALNEQNVVPRELKTRKTDADGRFEFAGLPPDHRFEIWVYPPGFAERRVWAVTNDAIDVAAKGPNVFKTNAQLEFATARKVPIQVVFADTQQPAPKVFVGTDGSWSSTDDEGRAELTLPDGKYRAHMTQRIGTPYIRSEDDLVVSESSVRQPAKLELKSAAVADITVVDAETGEPLAGVDIWRQEPSADALNSRRVVYGYRSWEAETRTSHYEQHRTDKNGKMEVLFQPGRQRIGVGLRSLPAGYEAVEPTGEVFDFETGKREPIKFQLRKRSESSTSAPIKAQLVQNTTAAPEKTEVKRPPGILGYGDDKPDGKKSLGGSGEMIRFELPEGVTKIKGIRIHGSRYGYPQAPKEDFEITFLNDKRDETLHVEAAPYRLFSRGKEQWVRVAFKNEVELPRKFWVCLNFNAQQTKGVYVSYDTSTKGEYSRAGLPGDKEEPKETDFKGDWMVQLLLAKPDK